MAKKKGSTPPGEPKPRLIDRQNRVALSPEAMAALGVKSGDYVTIEIDGKSARLHKVRWSVERV